MEAIQFIRSTKGCKISFTSFNARLVDSTWTKEGEEEEEDEDTVIFSSEDMCYDSEKHPHRITINMKPKVAKVARSSNRRRGSRRTRWHHPHAPRMSGSAGMQYPRAAGGRAEHEIINRKNKIGQLNMYTPVIAPAYFLLNRLPKYTFWHALTDKDATNANALKNRRLRDPNPMEDVPDKDSTKNPRTFFNFILVARARPALLGIPTPPTCTL